VAANERHPLSERNCPPLRRKTRERHGTAGTAELVRRGKIPVSATRCRLLDGTPIDAVCLTHWNGLMDAERVWSRPVGQRPDCAADVGSPGWAGSGLKGITPTIIEPGSAAPRISGQAGG
jgi:hypothetical protein